MRYDLQITSKAEQDILEAVDYIEFVLYNTTAADALLDNVDQTLSDLSFMPDKHPLIDDPVLKAWGIRFITVDNYLAFYLIDEPGRTVYIVRFLFSARDWLTILKEGNDISDL